MIKWTIKSLLQGLVFFQLFLVLCPAPLQENMVGEEKMSVQDFEP